MKKVVFFTFELLVLFFTLSLLFTCKSTEVVVGESTDTVADANNDNESADETVIDVEEIEDEETAEYLRSTQDVEVPQEVFTSDKNSVLEIVDILADIMEEYDYKRWLTYVSPEGISYWSNRNNLLQASKRLPVKGQKLNTLQDYFRLVFIPSRKGRRIDEIRYISLDHVKTVQVEDGQDIVYYNFLKVDGEWKLRLPRL